MVLLDLVITIAYDLVKEIKGAYDGVQENKELLEGLVIYTDVINFSLDQIQRKKHEFVDTSEIEEALQKCTIALQNAKHILLERGKKKKKLKIFSDMRDANKIKNEIEGAKVNLKASMLMINSSLGVIGAIRQDVKPLVSPDNNNWRIDSGDVSVKVQPDGNFEEILGYGSFSTVVKGVYKVNKKEISVAIKVPRNANEIEDCEELIKVFKKELRIFYSINHKNIVKFYGGIERNMNDLPSYRIVTEILDIDLERFIKENHDSLDREDRMFILEGVIDGLSHLHFVKIIHRDIKPKNIMLDENGTPKIIDFGLAKEKEDRARMTTKLCGTPAYAAPERKNKEPSSEGTDIYSFGLVGSFVFEAKDPPEDNHDEVRRYFHEKKSVDLRFEYIGQCLEKEVSKRISSHKLQMLMTEFRAKAEYRPPNANPLLSNQNLRSDAKPDSGSPKTYTNVNKIDFDAFSNVMRHFNVCLLALATLLFIPFRSSGVWHAGFLTLLLLYFFYCKISKYALYLSSLSKNGIFSALTVKDSDAFSKYFAEDDFFKFVEQGNIDEASKLFADNKQVLDTNARNANGLTVIEIAMKGSHWDMVEWLLDSGFVCEGVGKRVYDNDRYVGGLKDGKRNGRGRYTFANGAIYDGEWEHDKIHGRGRFTFANGAVYDGEYRDGKRHGNGSPNYGDVPIPTSMATKFGGGLTSVRNTLGGGQEDDPNYCIPHCDSITSLKYNIILTWVKKIKEAYDGVQENKELFKGLVDYTDTISFCLNQIQSKNLEIVDTSVIEEGLQIIIDDLIYAEYIIVERGRKKSKIRDMWNGNKIKHEIETAKLRLNHSMSMLNNSLGIMKCHKAWR